MNLNNFNNPLENQFTSGEGLDNQKKAQTFLGEEIKNINYEKISKIFKETDEIFSKIKEEIDQLKDKNITTYNKYKKTFSVDKEEGLTVGNIISARRWGVEVSLPKELEKSGDGKKIRNLMLEKKKENILFEKLNYELAKTMTEKTKHQDALKYKAYGKIAERSLVESKQFGITAEKIIIGFLEGLSIDRTDLGFNVLEANAYQDVQNKIDFIIFTKHKNRGVGVNREDVLKEEKSIGIQFTTNSKQREHKNDQINKAKERGVEVDDIVYVEIEQRVLQDAIQESKKQGKEIAGPWKFLPQEIRAQILKKLFSEILSEEQIKNLLG